MLVPSRSRSLSAALVLVAALVPGLRPALAGPPPARAIGRAQTAIRAVLAAQVEAWNRGDLEAFMTGYWRDDSLTFYSGGDVSHGWQPTLERYRRRYQGEGKEMGTLVFELHDVQVLATDVAVVKGGWALTLKDGAPRGLFTLILRDVPHAGWRIVHDHSSVAATP